MKNKKKQECIFQFHYTKDNHWKKNLQIMFTIDRLALVPNVLWYGVVREFEVTFLLVYTDIFYEPRTFENRWNPHALYHVCVPCMSIQRTHSEAWEKYQKYK